MQEETQRPANGNDEPNGDGDEQTPGGTQTEPGDAGAQTEPSDPVEQ